MGNKYSASSSLVPYALINLLFFLIPHLYIKNTAFSSTKTRTARAVATAK